MSAINPQTSKNLSERATMAMLNVALCQNSRQTQKFYLTGSNLSKWNMNINKTNLGDTMKHKSKGGNGTVPSQLSQLSQYGCR